MLLLTFPLCRYEIGKLGKEIPGDFLHFYSKAIFDNDLALVKKLVGLNVDNAGLVYPGNGWTPLHYAAYNNRKPVMEYLLTVVEDKEPLDKEGRTPVQFAIYYGKWDIAKMLLGEEYEHKILFKSDNSLSGFARRP